MTDLNQKNILITGAHGFLGQFIHKQVLQHNPKHVSTPSYQEIDLLKKEDCEKAVQDIDIIIHAAAKVGGIEANRNKPGEFFYENALMSIQLLEAARLANIEKFVQIGSVCEYPKTVANMPFSEEDLWMGFPEETNGPYGLAKKTALVHGLAYRTQYDMNIIHLLLVNMYGPGDHFASEESHVLAALVHRFWEAKQNDLPQVVCWGTGSPTREFLYVEDAAHGIVEATRLYDEANPINLGSGQEISIKDLATTIAKTMNYQGEIKWDTTKPDGQPRRLFDVSKAEKEFGFKSKTSFADGLEKTIAWYAEHIAKHAPEKIAV